MGRRRKVDQRGVVDYVKACRVLIRQIRLALNPRCDDDPIAAKWLILCCLEKPLGSNLVLVLKPTQVGK
jgi:hypothetical protein